MAWNGSPSVFPVDRTPANEHHFGTKGTELLGRQSMSRGILESVGLPTKLADFFFVSVPGLCLLRSRVV